MEELLPVRLALNAMATRFELVLYGANPVALRAAGEEALAEVTRLEAQLSIYRETSEIAAINAAAARHPVRVSPEVFALLQRACALSEETDGAFDITIAPLLRCWGFIGGSGHDAPEEAIQEARLKVGAGRLRLNTESRSVSFERPGMMLDLGAIGKGYAIERAAEILRDAGVHSALLHGGTSTIYGLGRPPEASAWRVALQTPPQVKALAGGMKLPSIELRDEALSVSGAHGKCFELDGKLLGHILDPRTGAPAHACVLAALVLPSVTDTDALSTGLLVGGQAVQQRLLTRRPHLRSLLVAPRGEGYYCYQHQMSGASDPV